MTVSIFDRQPAESARAARLVFNSMAAGLDDLDGAIERITTVLRGI